MTTVVTVADGAPMAANVFCKEIPLEHDDSVKSALLRRGTEPPVQSILSSEKSVMLVCNVFEFHHCADAQCRSNCYRVFVSGEYHGPGSQLNLSRRFELP